MKKINILITFLSLTSAFLQAQSNPITVNRSKAAINSTSPIPPANPSTNPFGASFGLNSGVESFRFGSGLVTQLDKGFSFTFEVDRRWFSLGRLDVGTGAAARTLYGMRFQRSGQGLTMGYGTLSSTPDAASNPFIEWIGNSGLSPAVDAGNLEFYTTNSPGGPTGPGIRKLSFTLRSDLTALLGETSAITAVGAVKPKLEINATDNRDGLFVNSTNSNTLSQSAFFSHVNTGGVSIGASTLANGASANGESIGLKSTARGSYSNGGAKASNVAATGVFATASGAAISNTGLFAQVVNGFGTNNYGVKIDAAMNNSAVTNNYGLFSNLTGSSAVGSINYGIYSEATGNNALAGFINGPAIVNTVQFPSDFRLKRDVKTEENLLSKIKQLTPVNYYFKQEKEKTGLNLPTELQHGFIAQELEKVFPELIKEVKSPIFDKDSKQTGSFDVKTVNYIELISVLVGAVKELSTEVETLKEQNNEKTIIVTNPNRLSGDELDKLLLTSYSLDQNVPNPFSDITSINYSLPENDTQASILLLNLSGQLIQEYKLTEAKGTITIDGSKMPKGIYLYSLVSDNTEILTKKMILK